MISLHMWVWKRVQPWIFPVACVGCGRPDVAFCVACRPAPAERRCETICNIRLEAVGEYHGLLRSAILAMKQGERAQLEPLAELIAEIIPWGVSLVPLPTSAHRRAQRGFDQAFELAQRAAHLRASACVDVLCKRGAAQRGRNRLARIAGARDLAIRPRVMLPEAAIVIDDVVTTGATLAAGVATLRGAGVAVVGAAVLARTIGGRNPRP